MLSLLYFIVPKGYALSQYYIILDVLLNISFVTHGRIYFPFLIVISRTLSSYCHIYFFPDFFIPPPTIGPFFPAFSAASLSAFCCSRCFALNALSSSSSSACCFFGALSGFFLPPSLPDISVFLFYKL